MSHPVVTADPLRDLYPFAIMLDTMSVLQDVPPPLRSFCAAADYGRAIADVALPFPCDGLVTAAREILSGEASTRVFTIDAGDGPVFLIRAMRYGNGTPAVLLTLTDISPASEEMRQRVADAALESRHRVRNMLDLLHSIMRRSIQGSRDADDWAQRVEGRLSALTRIQAIISGGKDTGIDLEYLIAEEFVAGGFAEGRHFSLSGPSVRLSTKSAEALSLAIHELLRNAIEHGCLAFHGGHVDVGWAVGGVNGSAALTLNWRERGGQPAPVITRFGFGREVLERSLPFELGAHTGLKLGAAGLEFTMVAALDRLGVHATTSA